VAAGRHPSTVGAVAHPDRPDRRTAEAKQAEVIAVDVDGQPGDAGGKPAEADEKPRADGGKPGNPDAKPGNADGMSGDASEGTRDSEGTGDKADGAPVPPKSVPPAGPVSRAGARLALVGGQLRLRRRRPGKDATGKDATGKDATGKDATSKDATSKDPQAGDGAAGQRDDIAGSALARLTTLPVMLIMAWLLPGLPLLLAGDFVPVPMLLISAPLLVALVVNGLRVVPSRWPRLIPGRAGDRARGSWFGLLATVAVAAGFAAWQLVERSQSVIVLRDQGTYLQAGYWLAQHGSLPIPQSLSAFGGAHTGLSFSSIGFFSHGTSVVPSLTSGLPMLLAGGFWAQAVSGAVAMGPVLGGLAVLTFGGLVARLAGPQWAPAGAIVLGLTLPEQYASRTSLAETVLQILLFGGLCLVIDSGTLAVRPVVTGVGPAGRRRRLSLRALADWLTPQRTMAGIGGLALGLGVLVSLDSLVYLLPIIPFAGLLIAARRTTAAPFCYGVVIGTSYGFADAYLVSRPFLDSVSHSMEIIGVIAAWFFALTLATEELLRVPRARAFVRRLAGRRPVRWLPGVVSVLAVAVLAGFAVRPYVQTVRGRPGTAIFHYIASLQQLQGLPVDPTRTYAEDTLYWAIWYIGLPTLLLGGFGVALLVRQCLRALLTWKDPSGTWRNWGLPLAMICAGSVAVLWQPQIVPDQPWASRRLVVVVLPGLIICALWAAAWLTGHARERGARAVTASIAGIFCVAALVVPTAATTFGAGLTHTGRSGGLRPNAQGMAFRVTGAGEVAAVEQLCASIQGNSSVVIIDRQIAQRFTQVIRGMCGVPAAWVVGQPVTAVDSIVSGISRAGRHPVLLGSRRSQLAGFGGTPVKVMDLRTTQDAHELTKPPTGPAKIHFVIWMLVPEPAAVGA
jgi:hypothetical protein